MEKEKRLGYTKQAEQILSGLSLEQKITLMQGSLMDFTKATPQEIGALLSGLTKEETHYNVVPYGAGGLIDKQLPPMLFCDGPRGVVCGVGQSTCFPVTMARGASFDKELEKEIGHAIGKEVRAFGGNLFAGVCINLPYHPGWGRSQETYGEESFHIGQMGASLISGVQAEHVMACIKHYAFNQMENARFKVSVTCDQRTEKEVFLPHFKDCIDAGAASVMSSYNRYNSIYCGHHNYLLNEVLKGEWDFDGFVISDFFFGIRDTVEACNGGMDIEMPAIKYFGERLKKAVENGFVSMERIDDAALRIIRTILAFDDGHKEYDSSVLACKEHVELAKKAAQESITLIKNDMVLPLNKEKVKKLALIGKLAKASNIGDYGSSRVRPPYVVTIEEGIKKEHPDCEIMYEDGSNLGAAKQAAREADVVVFVVGYNHDDEGEFVTEEKKDNYLGASGGDRKESLSLHEEDINLLREAGPENKNSIVVLIGGNTILMKEWYGKISAILMAYYPGMEGGTALSEILFGRVNPSGKLPFVVPYEETDLPKINWEAMNQYYEYYHGYTRLEKNGVTPMVPFGFGLSYTSFSIDSPKVQICKEMLEVNATITNTGNREGAQVVQLYVGFENSAIDRPIKLLRGFERIDLKAGECKEVKISCPLEKLKYYDPVTRSWILESMEYQIYIGSSSAQHDLVKQTILIENE